MLVTILGATLAIVGLFLGALALFCQKGEIERNHWMGVRTKESLASDENWKKINEYGAAQLLWGSVFILAAGAILCLLGIYGALDLPDIAGISLFLAVIILGVGIPTARTIVYSRKQGTGQP